MIDKGLSDRWFLNDKKISSSLFKSGGQGMSYLARVCYYCFTGLGKRVNGIINASITQKQKMTRDTKMLIF